METTIRLSKETAAKIRALGDMNDNYETVIIRLIGEKKTGGKK